MIVVTDTSPIINLAAIGQIELLHLLYGILVIPQGVYEEIVVLGAGQPGANEVQSAHWIQTQPITDVVLVQQLRRDLDKGESEAIALAIEIQADRLLMDERRGRIIAKQHGLSVIGLLGMLVLAKHHGHVVLIKPLLDNLRATAGFHVKPSLYQQVLASVGE
jgi:predicted nucleic acid-binding protein